MLIVPLPEWYPSMYTQWVREGRRLPVPFQDRVGYTVHHTAGGDGANPLSYAREVARFHYAKWSRPGGYNFLIGTDGVIRAMCGWGFVGAHAPTCNRSRVGVAFQGRFVTRLPNDKQLTAFSELVSQNRVPNDQRGHRDCSSTSCPGAELYRALPLTTNPPPENDMPLDDNDKAWILSALNTTKQGVAAQQVWDRYQVRASNGDLVPLPAALQHIYRTVGTVNLSPAQVQAIGEAVASKVPGADPRAVATAVREELSRSLAA